MKKTIHALAAVTVAILLSAGGGLAYTIDGDVIDWGVSMPTVSEQYYFNKAENQPTGTVDVQTDDKAYARPGGGTNQTYLVPGYTAYDSSTNGNIYDIEALYFDNDASYGYIALVTGQAPTGIDWPIGDIGIDVTDAARAALYDGSSYVGATDYEYAIDFGASSASLKEVTEWKNVYYDSSPNPNYSASDPWETRASSEIGTVAYAWQYFPGTDPNVDSLEHWVYEFSFALADLGLGVNDTLNLHWTMKCGNDNINLTATVDPVPEPATMALLGTGLIGLAGLGRKRLGRRS